VARGPALRHAGSVGRLTHQAGSRDRQVRRVPADTPHRGFSGANREINSRICLVGDGRPGRFGQRHRRVTRRGTRPAAWPTWPAGARAAIAAAAGPTRTTRRDPPMTAVVG
jgi:hypothetical protein